MEKKAQSSRKRIVGVMEFPRCFTAAESEGMKYGGWTSPRKTVKKLAQNEHQRGGGRQAMQDAGNLVFPTRDA